LQKAVAVVVEATTPVAAVDRLQAVDLQAAATPTAVRVAMSQQAMTTADPKVTKEWLTIAATIGIRCAIMTVTMDEPLRAKMTIMTMIVTTVVMGISSTVCGSGMAPRMLLTTAVG
jgi:hypothetical protein